MIPDPKRSPFDFERLGNPKISPSLIWGACFRRPGKLALTFPKGTRTPSNSPPGRTSTSHAPLVCFQIASLYLPSTCQLSQSISHSFCYRKYVLFPRRQPFPSPRLSQALVTVISIPGHTYSHQSRSADGGCPSTHLASYFDIFLGYFFSAILSAQHPISTLGHHRSQPPLPVTTRIQCASTNDGWTPLPHFSATSTTSRQTVACSSQPAAHHHKATTPIPSRASTPIDGCPTFPTLRHAKPLSACTELSQSTPLGPRKWGR